MTYSTIAGVAVWVALVSAPIFLAVPTPLDHEEAIQVVLEQRARAHERGDEAALRATSVDGFRSSAGARASEGALHGMDLRLDFVQFVTPVVASVGATWEAEDAAGHPEGDVVGTTRAFFYVVVKQDGRWRVSNVVDRR